MIYSWSLQAAGITTGLALAASHLWWFLDRERAESFLRGFPRSSRAGTVLLTLAAAWYFWVIYVTDLGDFAHLKPTILLAIPILWFLTLRFVEEFLAARALGILALLAAEPLLEAAFLRPEWSRLFLVSLTYIWIVLGIFWIGAPYLLRDQIAWVLRHGLRAKAAAALGLGYGLLLLGLAIFVWG